MIGRAKVAIVNQENIPKLELQAAIIGARLSTQFISGRIVRRYLYESTLWKNKILLCKQN